ncbi:MAG: PilZ domain-containing protein [Cellvibrio sp.]
MLDRRKFERTTTAIRVEIYHPSFGTYVGTSKDISAGGVQVQLDADVYPPMGAELMVRFKKTVGAINEEAVPMRVVHQFRNTLGLAFISR